MFSETTPRRRRREECSTQRSCRRRARKCKVLRLLTPTLLSCELVPPSSTPSPSSLDDHDTSHRLATGLTGWTAAAFAAAAHANSTTSQMDNHSRTADSNGHSDSDITTNHQQPSADTRPLIPTYHVPHHTDVHLDVEYRQRLHALIPAASLSQLQAVLLRLMGQQAALQLGQLISSLFHHYLPFAFTSSNHRVNSSSDALSGLRPALVPFTRDFLREAEKGFTETARYALTEQLDHITDFIQQQQHDTGNGHTAQHVGGTQKESVSQSNRSALAHWLHQITQQADRSQLLTLSAAFDAVTAAIPTPVAPIRSTSLPPASSTTPSASASAASTPPLSRTTSLFIQPAAVPRSSRSQHDVLMSGGLEPLCVILSYLPFSSLSLSTSLVSRRFFTATHDPRCWRLLRSLALFACPPPPLLALLLHKTQRLSHLSFPPLTNNDQLAALAADTDSHLSSAYLLAKDPFPLAPYLSRLTSLDLSGCIHLTDAAFEALTAGATAQGNNNPALQVLHQVEHLSLSGCSVITDAGFSALFAHLPSLLSLDLSHTGRISLSSFLVLTEHCRRLTSLDLSSCRSANDVIIRHVCTSLPALQSLLLSSCWSLTAQSLLHLPASLTELDVSGCYSAVSDRSVRSIALTCHGLTALSVRGCALTDAGMDIVMRGCRRLQSFDAGIGREGEGGAGVGSGSHYTDMLLVSLSKFARSLTSIVLTHCSAITDRGVLTLAQSCPLLTAVNFSHCPLLTNLSLLHIADSPIATSLNTATFSHCHRIDDHGTAYLVNKALSLATLQFAQCIAVTDRTLQFIARRLSSPNCAVRQVDLFRCPITDRGLLALGGVRRVGWCGLDVLLLGNCGGVSDGGVKAVAMVCSGLRELSLYGCTSITEVSLQVLGQYCSQPPHRRSAMLCYADSTLNSLCCYYLWAVLIYIV